MRFPLIVASLLALAACQPLPHPFEDSRLLPNSPLITPPDSAGIVVLPVAGAPGTTARDLADAMATALQDNDVPAGTEARNRGSYVLQGKATPKGLQDGTMQVTIVWAMSGPDGKPVGQQEITATMTASAWQDGGAGITKLVGPAAPELAKLIQSDIPMPAAVASDPLIGVHLAKGAPGDGDQALATAMSAALRRAQVSLADFPGAVPIYLVEVTVGITPPASGQQKVSINWTLNKPDGSQIGQVKQENSVEAGSLDKVWGLTAYDAANAAAAGIAALIDEAKRGAPHAS